MAESSQSQLKRELGVGGATAMGMGSIVGTGVFVSIGIAAGIAGPAVLLALALAAIVATFNGLNSAQLAAAHPVSGGTYEYGYRYLNPFAGFMAGWTFLLAKSASAATAALGFAGYLLNTLGVPGHPALVPIGLGIVLLFTALVLTGIRRTNLVNVVIVSFTIMALGVFVFFGLSNAGPGSAAQFTPFFDSPQDGPWLNALLHATALMFVAYTGYGRIATMGEEVRDPRKTIPRAVITTLILTMILYMLVAVSGIATVGAAELAGATREQAAPLEVAARAFASPAVANIVAIGAVTAMMGVLLNLILGLSRVTLAMGRRADLPRFLGRLNASQTTPTAAVVLVGLIIGVLVLIGDVRVTWSFSAFSVLIYYAITNLAALRLPSAERVYPKWLAVGGLAACLFLAFWIDYEILIVGIGMLVLGGIWHLVARRLAGH